MNITRNTALWLALLTAVAAKPAMSVMAQSKASDAAQPVPVSELPNGTITSLPEPTAEYSGKFEIQVETGLWWKKSLTVNPTVHANGAKIRYDEMFDSFWLDFKMGSTVSKVFTLHGEKISSTNDSIQNFRNIKAKKVKTIIIDTEKTTIFTIDDQQIVPKYKFTGNIAMRDDGVIVYIDGMRLNTEKENGVYRPIKVRLTQIEMGKQAPELFISPTVPANAIQKSATADQPPAPFP